jgi:hypothetical protein
VLLLNEVGDWPAAVYWYDKTIPTVGAGDAVEPWLEIGFDPTDPEPDLLEAAAHVALGIAGSSVGADAGPPTSPYTDVKPIDEYEAAVKLFPDSPVANSMLAWELYGAGRKTEAKAAYEITAQYGSGLLQSEAQEKLKRMF